MRYLAMQEKTRHTISFKECLQLKTSDDSMIKLQVFKR